MDDFYDDDYFEDDFEEDYDESDSFEPEENFTDTTPEQNEGPEKNHFDIDDATFWGGFYWTMSEELEGKRRQKKASRDKDEKDLRL